MDIKKVLFVGLGGAGQRHLRIFREILPEGTQYTAFRTTKRTPLLNSDFSVNHETTLEQKYNLTLFNSLEEALNDHPNLVVISTPSSLHYEPVRKAAEQNIHIFIEKPFSYNLEGFETFQEIVLKNQLNFFVSFQLRFHPYLRKIKEMIENGRIGKIINAHFNVCSFVPEWHKYENFRELYACRSDLGGGVLLTEIHELDLCYWYFGLPESVYCAGGNYFTEKLDVEDTAHLTLKYKNFSVQVSLCFMQKHNRRDLFIAGTKGYLEWNADGNRFVFNDYEKDEKEVLSDYGYSNDAMFISQAAYFLKHVNPSDSANALEAARASVAIVEAAKESMAKEVNIETPSGK